VEDSDKEVESFLSEKRGKLSKGAVFCKKGAVFC
jgi:hypothetical protein